MKIFLLILYFLILTVTFSACTNFSEEYRPLYQIKPELNPLKEEVRQVKQETISPEINLSQELNK